MNFVKSHPEIGGKYMDVLTVDTMDVPDIIKRDEAAFIRKPGWEEITVASVSERSNYLNYKI